MSELKTTVTTKNVAEFLEQIPDPQRREDCLAVAEMMRQATGAEPFLWGTSIVGFGRYHYQYQSGREGEWFVVGFSPRKNDLTLYLIPGFAGSEEPLSRLGKHRIGKSCLYIKRLADVDTEVLHELIEASVREMAPRRVDR